MSSQRVVRSRDVMERVLAELERAWEKFPRPSASPHEGWAVMYEEVDEMWDDVRANQTDKACEEAIQVAAMAIRFIVELEGT